MRAALERYFDIAARAQVDYADYIWYEITEPRWGNTLYWLIAISLFFFAWELLRPWRADQPKFRRDFWLDAFYMFFNLFLFSLVAFNAATMVVVNLFNDALGLLGITNLVALELGSWPLWARLVTYLLVRDFIQWNIHRLLHRVPWLWEFHKVHHSVEQMGFAASLRFHWMEQVVYGVLQYLPLAMIGFGIGEAITVNLFTLVIGHWNHSNIRFPLGPLRYILNNPQMHIWHHAKKLPPDRPYGMNYGITFSLWDYLFGTACIPKDGRDEPLGFSGIEDFPKTFWRQAIYGWRRER